jgi:hypothetical protein
MRRPALFDVDLVDAEVVGETLGFDQGGVPFSERDDVFFVKLRKDKFFLRPDAAHAAQTGIEELLPLAGWPSLQSIDVMTNFEQAAALFTAVNDLIEAVSDSASRKTFKPGS